MVCNQVEFINENDKLRQFHEFLDSPEIELLKKDFCILDHFLEELSEMNNWNKHTDQKDLKIYYR